MIIIHNLSLSIFIQMLFLQSGAGQAGQTGQTSYGDQSLQKKLLPAVENFLKKLKIPDEVHLLSSPPLSITP